MSDDRTIRLAVRRVRDSLRQPFASNRVEKDLRINRTIIIVVVSLVALVVLGSPGSSQPHNYEFTNGNWSNGEKFVARKFYSVGGVLTTRKPAQVDRTIDLAGKYVVPPFGEAHNHNLDWSSDAQFATLKRMYVEGGV